MIEKKYLYSPWRLDYILSEKPEVCILCCHQNHADDIQNLIVWRGKYSYIILNRYPYNNGHLMLVPYEHKSRLGELPNEVLSELMYMLKICETALYNVYHCDGINIGMNQGKAGGAGIDEHLHWHILPRWQGDSNFMSVVSGVRVIPEAFERTYEQIRKEVCKLLTDSE